MSLVHEIDYGTPASKQEKSVTVTIDGMAIAVCAWLVGHGGSHTVGPAWSSRTARHSALSARPRVLGNRLRRAVSPAGQSGRTMITIQISSPAKRGG